MGIREAQGETDRCNPGVGELLSACRDAQLSERNRRMVAQPHTHVHMEMLETSADTLQESATVWHRQMAGMAMGKYPKGLLADCSQPDTDASPIQ